MSQVNKVTSLLQYTLHDIELISANDNLLALVEISESLELGFDPGTSAMCLECR